MGCVILYFTNRSSSAIASFTTTLDNPNPTSQLRIDTKSLPDSSIQPEGQAQQTIMFESLSVFTNPPTIRVSYLAGALQALTLQLPVVIHKFMDKAELSAEDFFKRWRQIGGAPREAQKVFGLAMGSRGQSMGGPDWVKQIVEAFGWGLLKGIDPNERNVVGASVVYTGQGKLGCLLRLEPNWETKHYRLTIRATDENVPPVLLKYMEEKLAQGVQEYDHKQEYNSADPDSWAYDR